MAAALDLPARFTFIGGHPLGGAARGGIDAARADLFLGRPWLLTTPAGTPAAAIECVRAFVRALGATPRDIAADAHDRLLAFLSHLPQLTASALMQVVGEAAGDDGLALSGRGLRDTTRLAASPAAIWKDVCRTNADEIGAALDALTAVLRDLRADLARGDALERVFETAAAWKARLPDD
jgi:prephenate dehydrogenase